MSRLKIAYLLDAAIAIALVIIIPLLLDNTFAPANSLAYYLVAKIILGVIFLAAIAYGLLGKGANGSNTTIVAVATAYQLVPLLVRFLVLSKIPHADIIVVVTIAIRFFPAPRCAPFSVSDTARKISPNIVIR